jgi:hypothetical protein
MKNIIKYLNISIFLIIFSFFCISQASATQFNANLDKTKTAAGFGDDSSVKLGDSVDSSIATIVNIVLSIVGTLFFLLLLYAGFIWMNSKGNETEVKKAQSIIQQTIIGLTIVLLAYVITKYIF